MPLTARGPHAGRHHLRHGRVRPALQRGRPAPGADLLARRAAIAVDNARLFHEAEEALQEKERTLALLDTVFRGARSASPSSTASSFVRVNDALAALTGAPVETHLGRTVSDVLGPRPRRCRADVRGGLPDRPAAARPRDPVGPAAGTTAQRTFLASYYPVASPTARTEWVGCIVSDVTERRRAAELWCRRERMEAIARVAGGVAHEVNNMMTVITGFSGFLEGTLPPGDPARGRRG